MTKRFFEDIMRAAGAAAARVKREHMGGSAGVTPLVVQLDVIELGALDLWIEDQPEPKPSRQEAARRLINEALVRK
jgi:hypothetical protein